MIDKKKETKKPLTAEELTALRAAKAAARKLDQERAELLAKQLPKMSYRQVRAELRNRIRKNPEPWSIISLIVLENTQTKENPFAKLGAYPR